MPPRHPLTVRRDTECAGLPISGWTPPRAKANLSDVQGFSAADGCGKHMSTSPEHTAPESSRPAASTLPPVTGWQQKTHRLFLNRLTLPLLGLALNFAGMVTLAFFILAYPQHARVLYLLLALLMLAGLVLIWLITLRIRRDLVEPLSHLRNWSLRMRDGNLSARVPIPESGEF